MRRMATRAIIVTALTIAALALPAEAQQQGTTTTLSCNGTSKLSAAADPKPEPITSLGIIVNTTDRTVRFIDYVVPITSVSETLISFTGPQRGFLILGAIDRVT